MRLVFYLLCRIIYPAIFVASVRYVINLNQFETLPTFFIDTNRFYLLLHISIDYLPAPLSN